MARTRLVNGVRIPFTSEQELARDAEEALPPDPPIDPANTPLTPSDIERLLTGLGVTKAQIDDAKRSRT